MFVPFLKSKNKFSYGDFCGLMKSCSVFEQFPWVDIGVVNGVYYFPIVLWNAFSMLIHRKTCLIFVLMVFFLLFLIVYRLNRFKRSYGRLNGLFGVLWIMVGI